MTLNSKALAITSVLIVVSTNVLDTIFHELAHYATALYLNVPAELHHNYVMTPDDTPQKTETIIAAAGPLFSLVFGILILAISKKLVKATLLKLFTLWLGMGSILTFLGYLLIAPIAAQGDTGKVFAYLGFPIYVSIGIAIAAFIYTNVLFSKLAKEFTYYSASEAFDKQENKRQLFLYPIYGSIVIGLVLNLPVIIWISLLPVIFMPMTYFSTMGAYGKYPLSDSPLIVTKVSPALIVVALVCAAVFRYLV